MATDYELSRSNRKTISLIIKDGKLFVKAPLRTSVTTVESFISQKEKWINDKISESRLKSDKYANYIDYSILLVNGVDVVYKLDNFVKKIELKQNQLLVPLKYNADVIKHIRNWYRKTAATFLYKRLSIISVALKLPFSNFDLTNALGKWGSCDINNEIKLNWRLIMLEPPLIDYVIIHELCHTVEHNHSIKFWDKVKSFDKSFKEHKQALKDRGVLIKLFR